MQNILSQNKLYEKAISSLKSINNESVISFEEFKPLLKRAENWIHEIKSYIANLEDPKAKKTISNKIEIFSIPKIIDKKFINSLSVDQINGLKKFRDYIVDNDSLNADSIQNKNFTIAKMELEIPPRKMFEALYLVLLGLKSGSRLGPFILMLDKPWLIERLNQLW